MSLINTARNAISSPLAGASVRGLASGLQAAVGVTAGAIAATAKSPEEAALYTVAAITNIPMAFIHAGAARRHIEEHRATHTPIQPTSGLSITSHGR